MSVLIFIETADNHIKKASLEAICYGAKLAEKNGTVAEGIILGAAQDNLAGLGQYGLKKIHQVNQTLLQTFDAQVYAKIIAQAAAGTGADTVILSNTITGKALAPRLSVRLKAGLVSGAVALPETENGFTVRKNVFSGKAWAAVKVNTPVKIITLNPNAYPVSNSEGQAEVVPMDAVVEAGRIKTLQVQKASGEVPLTEAEIVVSAGRGMKGPEHWGIVEELAQSLHAATACSRPVADAHWRPHHEHVGQTGFAIAPNLYIAIGISGAIQHLAGVNRSKVIVVINKDPEAPFFKAADYGIVGDAFEVIPKMTAAIKKLRGTA